MALFYNRVMRKKPGDLSDPGKWYLTLRSIGLVGAEELGISASDETTLNPKEAEMAYSQLFKVLLKYLLGGHTVKLAGLGSFKLTLSCEGSDTEAEAVPSKVKNINVRFMPSQSFSEAINKATFKDVKVLAE